MPPISAVTIAPARRLRGRLRVPGDKSIAHRYALVGALAEGRTTVAHFAPGADCRSTLACLRGLGVEIEDTSAGTVTLLGRGFARLRSPAAPPESTRDHTERALAAFGGEVTVDDLTVSVRGGQRLTGQLLDVPGDFSSAAFWLVAAAALPGSRVEIEDVGLNPTRTALVGVLERFGARVAVEIAPDQAAEPPGPLTAEGE